MPEVGHSRLPKWAIPSCQTHKVLWTEDNPGFEGKYISFDDISFLPKPVQKPHPPIWVGGESRPALRRTAELANGWYPLGSNPTFPMGAFGNWALPNN